MLNSKLDFRILLSFWFQATKLSWKIFLKDGDIAGIFNRWRWSMLFSIFHWILCIRCIFRINRLFTSKSFSYWINIKTERFGNVHTFYSLSWDSFAIINTKQIDRKYIMFDLTHDVNRRLCIEYSKSLWKINTFNLCCDVNKCWNVSCLGIHSSDSLSLGKMAINEWMNVWGSGSHRVLVCICILNFE